MVISKAELTPAPALGGRVGVRLTITFNGHFSHSFQAATNAEVLQLFGEWYKNQS